MADRMEKIVKESRKPDGSPDKHPYSEGARVLLAENEAKRLEAEGFAVPVGGWVGEKDMGETKTDNEVGVGYGPEAVKKRNSNVARSFTEADLEADAEVNDKAFDPTSGGAAVRASADTAEDDGK